MLGTWLPGTWSCIAGVGSLATGATGSTRSAASTGWAGSEACANTCSCGPFRQEGLLTYCSWLARSSEAAPKPNTRMEARQQDRGKQEAKAGKH